MRVAAAVALLAYLTSLGCSSMREIPPAEIKGPDEKILTAKYASGRTVEFTRIVERKDVPPEEQKVKRGVGDIKSVRYGTLDVHTQTITGTLKDGHLVSIPVADVQTVQVKRFSLLKTALLSVGAYVGFVAIALSVDPQGD